MRELAACACAQMQTSHLRRRHYSQEQGLAWMVQVAKGLKYLHSARPMVVWRDGKLENILMRSEAPLKHLLHEMPRVYGVPPRLLCWQMVIMKAITGCPHGEAASTAWCVQRWTGALRQSSPTLACRPCCPE